MVELGEARKWQELREMSAAESLAVGEALWTSDLMRIARISPSRRPPSLAVALGIQQSR
ncbi:MAG: hypothetical protein ABJE66_20260 [Deltaproteobacteria bacterium]